MRDKTSMTSKVSNMRTLAAFALAIVYLSSPITVRAQASAAQYTALQQPQHEQLRRIEALEAVLAQLQQELTAVKGQQQPYVAENKLEEPFDHAFDGSPPEDTDPKDPAGDLPKAPVIDTYGSLRALTAL